MENIVVCCFCNEALEENVSSIINIRIAKGEDEFQSLFAHNNCIINRVHKSVPFLVSRTISCYSNETEKFISEIELDMELPKLQEIIGADKFKDDIFLYQVYELNELQVLEFLKLLNRVDKIDLVKYSYYLESHT